MTSTGEFRALVAKSEGTGLEFKAARSSYHFDDLVKYCVALANEGGGKFILGVSDSRPRQVIGTRAFMEPGKTELGFYERVGHPISVEEHDHKGKRILIVHVPPRSQGTAWCDHGTYWMRAGEALLPMTDDRLREIHAERARDTLLPEQALLRGLGQKGRLHSTARAGPGSKQSATSAALGRAEGSWLPDVGAAAGSPESLPRPDQAASR